MFLPPSSWLHRIGVTARVVGQKSHILLHDSRVEPSEPPDVHRIGRDPVGQFAFPHHNGRQVRPTLRLGMLASAARIVSTSIPNRKSLWQEGAVAERNRPSCCSVLSAPLAVISLLGLLAVERAHAAPALVDHIEPASVLQCGAILPQAVSREDIIVEGDSTVHQSLYVLTAQVPEVEAVQFGIEYDPSVEVMGWTLCADGMQIPSVNAGGGGYNPCGTGSLSQGSGDESYSDDGILGRWLTGDTDQCTLSRLVYSSSCILVGDVIAVVDVRLPPLPEEVRKRFLPFSVPPDLPGLETPTVVEDLYQVITINVWRSLLSDPGTEAEVYQHRGSRLSNHKIRFAGDFAPVEVGELVVAFCRDTKLRDPGQPSLILPEGSLVQAFDPGEPLSEAIWDRLDQCCRSASMDQIIDTHWVVEGVVVGMEHATAPYPHRVLHLQVLEAPSELGSIESLDVRTAAQMRSPLGTFSCAIGPLGVFEGDTILVPICEDTDGFHSCLDGWSVLRRAGGRILHGFHELKLP